MTAVQTKNGQKKSVQVFRFKDTTNAKYKQFAGDICVIGKTDDSRVSIRLLANYETITTSEFVTSINLGGELKVYTRNSVYTFEVL